MAHTCYIIGAGDVFPTDLTADEKDFIICADGGYKYSSLLGRECDLVVGDFDSLGKVPEIENKIIAPCEKDDTDMTLAVKEGFKRGYRDFVLYGALGGERFDHTVANIQLLNFICCEGGRGTIIHQNTVLAAFSDGEITFPKECTGYASVFSLCDESYGVTIKNMKYSVEGFTLRSNNPIGVSNEFTGKESSIAVKDGTLLVVYNKKQEVI